MLLGPLTAFMILVSSDAAALVAANSNNMGVARHLSDIDVLSRALLGDHEQVKRSLRWYDSDEKFTEERGMEKLDDVIEKLVPKADDAIAKILPKADDQKIDDAVAKMLHKSPTLPKNVNTAALVNVEKGAIMSADEIAAAAKKAVAEYPTGLSSAAMKQIEEIEITRVQDVINGVKGTKKTADGMRRDVEPFDGMKIAPKQFLESHVGREQQLFGKDGSRLLSAAVVSRSAKEGGGDVLLISSSNPTKGDWLLPKGGWDKGEDVKRSALREVIEEGGVNAQLAHNLRRVKFSEGEKSYTYYAYMMKSRTVYDQWAESVRYRIWVSYDDAIKLLAKRPHMVEVVYRAMKKDAQVKAGTQPEFSPNMKKFTLDLE